MAVSESSAEQGYLSTIHTWSHFIATEKEEVTMKVQTDPESEMPKGSGGSGPEEPLA